MSKRNKDGKKMMTPRDRYLNDPCFNSLVKSLLSYLHQSQCTQSEMQEAAVLACTIYEEDRTRLHFLQNTEREAEKL